MAKKINCFVGLIGVLILFSGLICSANAAEKDKPKEEGVKKTSVMKAIEGEITWVRNGKIAIVYKKDIEQRSEEEMLLPIDKNVTFEHLKDITGLAYGDKVYIQFEELTEETPEGVSLSRTAKKISLIKKSDRKPISAPAEATSEGVKK